MDVVALARIRRVAGRGQLAPATPITRSCVRNSPDVSLLHGIVQDGAGWKRWNGIARMKDGRPGVLLFIPDGEDQTPSCAGRRGRLHGAERDAVVGVSIAMAIAVNCRPDGKARMAERCKPLRARSRMAHSARDEAKDLVELTAWREGSTPNRTCRCSAAVLRRSRRRRRRARARRHVAAADRGCRCRCSSLSLAAMQLRRRSAGRMIAAEKERPAITTAIVEHFPTRWSPARCETRDGSNRRARERPEFAHPQHAGVEYVEQRCGVESRDHQRGMSSLSDAEKLELRELQVQLAGLKRELAPVPAAQ